MEQLSNDELADLLKPHLDVAIHGDGPDFWIEPGVRAGQAIEDVIAERGESIEERAAETARVVVWLRAAAADSEKTGYSHDMWAGKMMTTTAGWLESDQADRDLMVRDLERSKSDDDGKQR